MLFIAYYYIQTQYISPVIDCLNYSTRLTLQLSDSFTYFFLLNVFSCFIYLLILVILVFF